jgi:hypothetical protein
MNQIYIFNFISKFFHTDMVSHVYTQKTYLILYNTRTTQVKLSFTTQFYEIKSILFIYCTRNFKPMWKEFEGMYLCLEIRHGRTRGIF